MQFPKQLGELPGLPCIDGLDRNAANAKRLELFDEALDALEALGHCDNKCSHFTFEKGRKSCRQSLFVVELYFPVKKMN